MLRYRLLLGPMLIGLLVAVLWMDEWLDGQPLPGVLEPLLFGRETYPPGTVLFVGMVPVSFLAARELARILHAKGIAAARRYTCAAALMGLIVSCLVPSDLDAVVSVAIVSSAAIVVLVGALGFYSRNRSIEGVIAASGGALLSFVYLGLMFGFVLAIRRDHSAWTLLWVLMVAKSCDIGAYFTGRSLGRHKLIPWLSPGKTWEGLGGGVLTSMLVGMLGLWLLVRMDLEPAPAVLGAVAWGALAGILFGLTGQAGDLLASLLKRDAGAKDAGGVLPGFGGVIDVLDSPLLVAPVAFWWMLAMANLGAQG